jgi:hypothetical protein
MLASMNNEAKSVMMMAFRSISTSNTKLQREIELLGQK